MESVGSTPREVRIYPAESSTEDMIKALEGAARGLRKKRPESVSKFKDQNPATRKLSEHVDGAFKTMMASLFKEIEKELK